MALLNRSSMIWLALAAAAALSLWTTPIDAAELVMVRRAGCPYCAQWDRQVGPIYPKTELGQALPLRMIDLDQPPAQNLFLKSPIRYTPTFVIVADRREIARLEGFPGEDFFWGFLDSHFNRLKSGGPDVLSGPAPSQPVPHGTPLPP